MMRNFWFIVTTLWVGCKAPDPQTEAKKLIHTATHAVLAAKGNGCFQMDVRDPGQLDEFGSMFEGKKVDRPQSNIVHSLTYFKDDSVLMALDVDLHLKTAGFIWQNQEVWLEIPDAVIALCQDLLKKREPACSMASWVGKWGLVGAAEPTFEEWTDSGFVLVGKSYSMDSSQEVLSEQIRLFRNESGSVIYEVHLPNLEGPVPFTLVENLENEWIFENLQNDFPHRIHYKAIGTDSLWAEISDSMGMEKVSFPMRRVLP